MQSSQPGPGSADERGPYNAGFDDSPKTYDDLRAEGHMARRRAEFYARVLDATARLLGTDVSGLDTLAAQAPLGAGGLVLVPYLEGERTPNLPLATGSLTMAGMPAAWAASTWRSTSRA